MLLDKLEAMPEIGVASLVGARREILPYEWCIHADEIRSLASGTNGKIEFSTTPEPFIEPAQTTKHLRPCHQCTAPQHAPRMAPVAFEETQHVVGDYRSRGRRIQATDTKEFRRRPAITCSNDDSIRITKDHRPRLTRFVLQDPSVLSFEPFRRALVIVVEERDDRTSCMREQGVAGFRHSPVRVVTDNADLVVRPLEPAQ